MNVERLANCKVNDDAEAPSTLPKQLRDRDDSRPRSAVSLVEQTLDEVDLASSGAAARGPVLFVPLEADRPLARGARFSLAGVERVTIGRGDGRHALRSADGRSMSLRLPGRWVSTQHASIRAVGADFILEDLGSRNGTFVNGERVASAVLRQGDVVEIGRVFLSVRGAPAPDGPIVFDSDAARSSRPFGLRTLLPELEESYAALTRIAQSMVPVLLLGPTGSGKEVLAREIHAQSLRTGPFFAVNCGALPSSLVESLLFGHVKGAFSGAARDEVGFVRSADGGTLFLDEIGDLPATSQAALLRVLQEHEVIPIGSTRAVRVDVRVVAATHRPIEALLGSGLFRDDLLARLKGYTHRLPALAARMGDFGVVLADVLMAVAGNRASRVAFTPEAARAMLAYRWPLNVRELEQAIASALALTPGDVIEACHLPAELFVPTIASMPSAPPEDPLRDRIVALLQSHRGNVTAVARAMGKAPAQINRWLHRFNLEADSFRPM
jgi:transcriptional regulator with AAA-type ATPase domain